MDLGIAGRWGIVCASSRGIGRACATALSTEGVNVALNGRDSRSLNDAASELRRIARGEVVAVTGDVRVEETRRALLAACPSVDILITNAGGPAPARLLDASPSGGQSKRTIGLLHPGEMGAAIGAGLVAVGHRVIWASEGRTVQTAVRAERAGLEDLVELAAVVAQSDVILSIVPPSEAVAMATAIRRFAGIYVDLNAIAPGTARRISKTIETRGGRFVDGAIIGAPPSHLGDSRTYLSGAGASEVAAVFDGSVIDVAVVGDRAGDASAVKVAYAGWTKATVALLLLVREYARLEGVEAVLSEEWAISQPHLDAQWKHAQESLTNKGWRWAGEMREISHALAAKDLPCGFHEAAAQVFAAAKRPPR